MEGATDTPVPREKLDLVDVPIATLWDNREFEAIATVLVDSIPLPAPDSNDGEWDVRVVRGVRGEGVEKVGSDVLGLDCKISLVLICGM